ncbi:hypothetical protein C7M84_003594 [Penaeus vannamei]|uniref:Uncharacterized protein n=1 Tax=Penaeus vannamei TaxID=6689 RepID=A0A3R7MBY1_PENVA|nr:hypothetical protein C7M84_003594 [Penaeus vannamei]
MPRLLLKKFSSKKEIRPEFEDVAKTRGCRHVHGEAQRVGTCFTRHVLPISPLPQPRLSPSSLHVPTGLPLKNENWSNPPPPQNAGIHKEGLQAKREGGPESVSHLLGCARREGGDRRRQVWRGKRSRLANRKRQSFQSRPPPHPPASPPSPSPLSHPHLPTAVPPALYNADNLQHGKKYNPKTTDDLSLKSQHEPRPLGHVIERETLSYLAGTIERGDSGAGPECHDHKPGTVAIVLTAQITRDNPFPSLASLFCGPFENPGSFGAYSSSSLGHLHLSPTIRLFIDSIPPSFPVKSRHGVKGDSSSNPYHCARKTNNMKKGGRSLTRAEGKQEGKRGSNEYFDPETRDFRARLLAVVHTQANGSITLPPPPPGYASERCITDPK